MKATHETIFPVATQQLPESLQQEVLLFDTALDNIRAGCLMTLCDQYCQR